MGEMKDLKKFKEEMAKRGFLPAFAQAVLEIAQAVDAVEVVRCKDCGHGERGADNIVRCNHPSGKRIMMTAYGFCNYGQRREDG